MGWDTDSKLIDKSDNIFQTVNQVAKESRHLINKYPVLSQSESLTWVINKVPPKSLLDPKYQKDQPDRLLQLVDEVCKYVSDVKVRRAVYISAAKSLRYDYPIFDLDTVAEVDHPRVRVCVKQLLDLIDKLEY